MDNSKQDIKMDSTDGILWILEGLVYVKNETNGGMPPFINPCENVKLMINGTECKYLRAISEKNRIELITEEYSKEMDIKAEISENGLEANFKYSPPVIIKRQVNDMYPVNKLDVELSERVILTNTVTKMEMMDELIKQGIVYGIDENALEDICRENLTGYYHVASGKIPIDPEDEWLECLFSDELTRY